MSSWWASGLWVGGAGYGLGEWVVGVGLWKWVVGGVDKRDGDEQVTRWGSVESVMRLDAKDGLGDVGQGSRLLGPHCLSSRAPTTSPPSVKEVMPSTQSVPAPQVGPLLHPAHCTCTAQPRATTTPPLPTSVWVSYSPSPAPMPRHTTPNPPFRRARAFPPPAPARYRTRCSHWARTIHTCNRITTFST